MRIFKRKQKPVSRLQLFMKLSALIVTVLVLIDTGWLFWQHRQAQEIVDIVGLYTAFDYCTDGDNPVEFGYEAAAKYGIVDGAEGINFAVAINEAKGDTLVVLQYPVQALLLDVIYPIDRVSNIVFCSKAEPSATPPMVNNLP